MKSWINERKPPSGLCTIVSASIAKDTEGGNGRDEGNLYIDDVPVDLATLSEFEVEEVALVLVLGVDVGFG